jgi:hypothetical protein
MSPVLASPVLPSAPAITPNYTALLCDPEFKNVIKSLFFTLLEEDSEFKETVRGFIDCSITMSEHNILKRISTTEKVLGLNDYPVFCEEEEHEPTIPEQIKELSIRIEQPLNNITEEKIDDSLIIPSTSLDFKATALMVHMIDNVKPNWAREVTLNNQEFYDFMKNTISENLRWKADISNPRQPKKEIFERAVELYPNILEIKQNKSGNKVTGIALKASLKRRDTDTC